MSLATTPWQVDGGGLEPETSWAGNLLYNTDMLFDADGAQPIYWSEEDGNVTLTKEDAAGESIPEIHLQVFKIVNGAGGADKYIYQRLVLANEGSLDASVTSISAGCWVYTASAGTITLTVYDVGGSASLGTGTTSTTGSWQWLEVNGKTLGTTSVDFRLAHSANSATFYIAIPSLNVGSTVLPWEPRVVSESVQIEYQLAQNNNGGTFTQAAWRVVVLNTLVKDTTGQVTLGSNQFTPPTGVYKVLAMNHGLSVQGFQSKLWNDTDGADALMGRNGYSRTTSITTNISNVMGWISTPGSKAFELQSLCDVTKSGNGFGQLANYTTEVYASVSLEKVV